MKSKWLAISALTISLGATSGALTARAYAAPVAPQAGYQEGSGRWDEPPSEYREAERQGYHDGIEAARRDFERHKMRDADDHDTYRRPRVEPSMRDEYREGFRSGYQRASTHMREEHHDHDSDHRDRDRDRNEPH